MNDAVSVITSTHPEADESISDETAPAALLTSPAARTLVRDTEVLVLGTGKRKYLSDRSRLLTPHTH